MKRSRAASRISSRNAVFSRSLRSLTPMSVRILNAVNSVKGNRGFDADFCIVGSAGPCGERRWPLPALLRPTFTPIRSKSAPGADRQIADTRMVAAIIRSSRAPPVLARCDPTAGVASSRKARPDDSIDGFSGGIPGHFQLVVALEIHPKLGTRSKESSQPQGGVGSDRPATASDLIHAGRRNVQLQGQAV